MSDILAAFLYAQLERSDHVSASRQRIWDRYREHLSDWAAGHDVRLPHVPESSGQSYHMFYMVMPTGSSRQALIEALKARGILSVFHYLPLHASPMGVRAGGRPGQCPVTESVSDRLIRLPFYNDLTDAEQDEVIAAIHQFDRWQG
jgi:dTDP-4-amino-4,6-dideoxygalactose transaminase